MESSSAIVILGRDHGIFIQIDDPGDIDLMSKWHPCISTSIMELDPRTWNWKLELEWERGLGKWEFVFWQIANTEWNLGIRNQCFGDCATAIPEMENGNRQPELLI